MFVLIKQCTHHAQHYVNLIGETVEVTKDKVFGKDYYKMVGILYFEELPKEWVGTLLEILDCEVQLPNRSI